MFDRSPRVSVLVPLYNMREFVEQGLRSVVNQDLRDVEVVVVDDGSTDGSREVAQRLAEETDVNETGCLIRYLRQENRGKPAALNTALSASRGAYVTVLDPDDCLPERSLRVRYGRALKNNADLVIGAFDVVQDGQITGRRAVPKSRDPERIRRRFYLSLSTPFHFNACLMSRTLVDRVGEFDVRLQRCQDGDYAIRCLAEASAIEWVQHVVYRYRKHRSGVLDRWGFRRQTALYRPLVLVKNFGRLRGGAYSVVGMLLDAGKFMYESLGNYGR